MPGRSYIEPLVSKTPSYWSQPVTVNPEMMFSDWKDKSLFWIILCLRDWNSIIMITDLLYCTAQFSLLRSIFLWKFIEVLCQPRRVIVKMGFCHRCKPYHPLPRKFPLWLHYLLVETKASVLFGSSMSHNFFLWLYIFITYKGNVYWSSFVH